MEEPFALSKNTTGLLLTLGMVISALLCCGAVRLLTRNTGAKYKSTPAADDDFRPRDDEEPDDDDEDVYSDDPSARSFDEASNPRGR